MNEHEFRELAAGYVLGALSPEDERAFAEALIAHPEWSHHVERDHEVVAFLAEAVPSVEVPASMRDSLLARIAQTPQGAYADASPDRDAPRPPDETAAEPPEEGEADPDIVIEPPTESASETPADPASAPRRGWGSRAWFALAASVALILGIGGGTALVVGQLDRPAAVVALERIEGATDAQTASGEFAEGGEATLHWSESVGEAVLISYDMPELGPDESYELWYVRDGQAISAGAFEPTDDRTAALLSGEMHAGDVIALTVEQTGGSPSGQPTTEPIIAIPTA